MSEPGFEMRGGWQDELDFGDLPDPYEDADIELEDDEIELEFFSVDGRPVVSLNGQGRLPMSDCE